MFCWSLTPFLRPSHVAQTSTQSTKLIQSTRLATPSPGLGVLTVRAMDSNDQLVWWTCRKGNGMLSLYTFMIYVHDQSAMPIWISHSCPRSYSPSILVSHVSLSLTISDVNGQQILKSVSLCTRYHPPSSFHPSHTGVSLSLNFISPATGRTVN